MNRTIEPREHWNARKPIGGLSPLNYDRLVGWSIHWAGVTYPAIMTDHQIIQAIQNDHMYGRPKRGKDPFSDIGYNYVIGRQAHIFEARGHQWIGAHTRGHNSRYMGLLIVLGPGERPSQAQLDAAEWLMNTFASRGVPPVAHPHSANVSTECPGDSLRLWAAQYTKRSIETRPYITSSPTKDTTPPSVLEKEEMTPAQREAVARIQQSVNATGYQPPLVIDGDPGPKTATAVEAMSARVDPLDVKRRLAQLVEDANQ